MKRVLLLLTLTLAAGNVMAQTAEEKAKAKAEAAALKAAQKEVKEQVNNVIICFLLLYQPGALDCLPRSPLLHPQSVEPHSDD